MLEHQFYENKVCIAFWYLLEMDVKVLYSFGVNYLQSCSQYEGRNKCTSLTPYFHSVKVWDGRLCSATILTVTQQFLFF